MLSGNGRHRRPRQAPALLVAAGVTGTAIALPLLAASGASAADGTTWDKVADCASDGSWSQDTGNGRYGGLQLSQDDWETYGGLDYAPSADLASRNQQIAVAEKVLADQGVGAFRTCGLTAGLTQDSGLLDIDTGLGGDSSDSSDTSDTSASTGLSNSSGESAESSPSSDPSADTPSTSSPSPSSPAKDGTRDGKGGKGTGSAAPSASASSPAEERTADPREPAASDTADNARQDAGSWSLVDTGAVTGSGTGKHRGQSAEDGRTEALAADTYTVREGDTLGSIADSLGLDGGWRALYDANRGSIGSDPSSIVPGQTLEVG
ncbi:transglycosylase family protein [Streptomyces sp. ACT015]|uniref:transglycosylase family protein n=1 Tax=Streptomyces sp. ACT015 TaxID=3134807 RepID=UPI003D1784EE